MTTAKPWRVSVWLPIVAGLALAFFLGIPQLPGFADTERPVEPGEVLTAQTASFVPATGWSLDLDAATNARPTVMLDGVTVQLRDGVWFGSTASLLTRLSEQLSDAGASVGPLPDASTDDGLVSFDPDRPANTVIPRAEYVIEYTSGDVTGRLLVVREDATVALLRSTGAQARLEQQAAAIAQMEASVETGAASVGDLPTDPR